MLFNQSIKPETKTPMRKAGEVFSKEGRQSIRDERREDRQKRRTEMKKHRQTHRASIKSAREKGASKQELNAMRQPYRSERQRAQESFKDSRKSFKDRIQNNRQVEKDKRQSDRIMNRHFTKPEEGMGYTQAVTPYKDNKTGKTIFSPSGAYRPKDNKRSQNRFTKIDNSIQF